MTINGFLIDPKQRSIAPLAFTNAEVKKILGCSLIDTVRLDAHKNFMFVDDEGLMTSMHYFTLRQYEHMVLAGRALVAGVEPHSGKTIDATLTDDALRAMVQWLDPETALSIAMRRDRLYEGRSDVITVPVTPLIEDTLARLRGG